jgi:uncharacterized protein
MRAKDVSGPSPTRHASFQLSAAARRWGQEDPPRAGSDSPTPKCAGPERLDNTHINTHTNVVRYSFDPAKQASNRKKHGLSLADAKSVIESGMTVTFEDRRFDSREERFVTLGPLGDTLVAIVTAASEDHIRIISMRKADRYEQAIYRENFS